MVILIQDSPEMSVMTTITTFLKQEETELLDALASHLASSLEGLRVAALEREAAVAQERTMLARNLHDSIAQSLAFLKIQVQLLRSADERSHKENKSSDKSCEGN
jgi:two-component system nitrate/nitrite sensor histidine kinase NarX